jgi:hypothetical protein
MLNVAELINAIVAKLQDIPDLVACLKNQPEAIFAYHDIYPSKSNLLKAIATMKSGQIMVAWAGCQTPGASMGYWSHNIQIFVRAAEEDPSTSPDGYYRIIRLIFDGIPRGGSCSMRQLSFLPYLDPMTGESAVRLVDEQGADYFEVRFQLVETVPV